MASCDVAINLCQSLPRAPRQGLTLVHRSARLEPFLSLKPPNASLKKCSQCADMWTSTLVHLSLNLSRFCH